MTDLWQRHLGPSDRTCDTMLMSSFEYFPHGIVKIRLSVDTLLAVPHPGAHCSVVEENGSVASNKHWLPVLIDDVIVNPGGNSHVKHNQHDPVSKCLRDLLKMESWQSPLIMTLLTGAATSQMLQRPRSHFSSTIFGFVIVASVVPESF